MTLTAERLREFFHYDHETGVFTRKVGPKAGAVAIGGRRNGYLRLVVDGTRYSAHRLAWLYMTGSWPAAEVDHIDGVRGNNRWANLRQATRSQNQQNKRGWASSGFKGCRWHRRDRKWTSSITVEGHSIHLGNFDTVQEARSAYASAARKHYGEFARPT